MRKGVESISKMALMARAGGFRREAADGASRCAGTPRVSTAAGTIRTRGTMSRQKPAEQKSADSAQMHF
ncbi:MAG: hypothetical protein HY221_00295 [Candidatus Sungbacteria bacterium]|uniref:Uncharacterized protein n=1 Tax=Candidatus Sungiibacteriota bacterium TaxID=2750080 RepID=A0A932QZL1_9BACT|nr:hypothetical protein [Candidatus Sungbacteria bacterium]